MGKSDAVTHNVRFYNLETRAIHCIALERNKKKLALARADNSIEIWDVNHTPNLQKVIFNDSSNSVEDIKWFNDRLFTCGLEGYIVEYDCLNESVLNTTPVTGGPAWCIDINLKRKLMACGTEDGYINVLDLGYGKLEHFKFLDKQQGRILCLCWDRSGQHIITGSMDVVRVWNVDTGHAIHKMNTGRSEHNKETVVWCVTVTSDFTIISGDSRGVLCFWDGKIGTQIQSNNCHTADILSLVLNESETTVYCAGVDPVIAVYGKVSESSGSIKKWAKGPVRRIHEHDIRALALTKDEKLFSGGIDGYLALSSHAPKILVRFPPFLKGPSVSVAPSKRYLFLRYLTHLELWKLGQPQCSDDTFEAMVHLAEREEQLMQLKAKRNDVIVSAALSEDGEYIAYSTERAVSFFKFSAEETVSLTKLPEPNDCGPCRIIHFYRVKAKHFCACATKQNDINILEVEDSGPDVIHTIRPQENEILSDTISQMVVSTNGDYLIAGDCQSNIGVWSRATWSLICRLPKYQASLTALSIRGGTSLVVAAYSDHKVVEFDVKRQQYTRFSKSLKSNYSDQLHTTISGIAFDERRGDSVLIHDDSLIFVLYRSEMSCDGVGREAKKVKGEEEEEVEERQKGEEISVNIKRKPRHIAKVLWLGGDEMVIVSVNPIKLKENLPPTLAKKLFGT